MKYFSCAVLAGALLAGVPATAQKKGADPERQFRKADRNGDGKVTLEEFKGKGKGDTTKREKAFRKRDKNGDGALSLEEFSAAGQKGKKRKR